MQSTEQKFNFSRDIVYETLLKVLPDLEFKIVRCEKQIARIDAKVGVSAFSWGENVSIVVEAVDSESSRVRIESSLKIGVCIGGLHRHQKHFSDISFAVADYLSAR